MAYVRILACALPRFMRIPFLKQNTRRNEFQNILLCEGNPLDVVRQKVLFSTRAPVGIPYEKLCKCLQLKRRLLIDVRDRDEVKESGAIPGSVNLPLCELEYALEQLDDDQFEQLYCIRKPEKNDGIIFYCKNSRRAREAAERACALGYTKINFYIGGYTDWKAHNP